MTTADKESKTTLLPKLSHWLHRPRPSRTFGEQSLFLFVLAIICLFLHYIALAHFEVQPGEESFAATIAQIPREISIALLIAGVLNFIVERNTQRRHAHMEKLVMERMREESADLNSEIQKNLLTAVFHQNLGEHAIAQIKGKLFQPTLYRLTSQLAYSLELKQEGDHTFVVLEGCFTFVTTNRSTQRLPLEIAFETLSPKVYGKFSDLISILVDGDEVLNKDKVQNNNGSLLYIDETERFVEPNTTVTTSFKFTRADYSSGAEVLCSRLPVEQFEVTVVHARELRLFAMPLHSEPVISRNNISSCKTWALRGLLPGQGLSFNWMVDDDAKIKNVG